MEKYCEIFKSYFVEHYPTYEFSMFTAESEFDRATIIMNMIKENDPIPTFSLSEKDEDIAATFISSGTDYLARGKSSKALECFNIAIMYAPANSVSYIAGFGKRSECLCRKGFFNEGLFSVEHALKCTGIELSYKEELKKQLKFCEEFANSNSSSAVSSCPNGSYSTIPTIRNEYLTSASNKVAVSTDTSVGRLLKAAADIRTGELVMIEEPYARGIDTELRFTHCWNCSKYCKTPYPCTKCKDAMFCGQNCLEEAKKYHDFECPMMDLLIHKLGVRHLYLLAFHMFLIATENGTKLKELKQKVDNIDDEFVKSMTYDSNDFIRIYSLRFNPIWKSPFNYCYLSFLAGYIVTALSKCTGFCLDDTSDLQVFACSLLLRFILIVECNAMSIKAMGLQDGEPLSVGEAIFATFSVVNHSCEPNVDGEVINQSLIIRAIKPIKAGEELGITYSGDFAFDCFSKRQDDHEQFNITCTCRACEHRWPMYSSQLSTIPELKKPMDDTVFLRFSELCDNFTETFKFESSDNKLQLVSDVTFTPKILDWLCEFIDLFVEYFDIPHQRLTEALEVLTIGFENVVGYHRSFDTTEDTDTAAPSNE